MITYSEIKESYILHGERLYNNSNEISDEEQEIINEFKEQVENRENIVNQLLELDTLTSEGEECRLLGDLDEAIECLQDFYRRYSEKLF